MEIVHIDPEGRLLQGLVKQYEDKQLAGVIAITKSPNGNLGFRWSPNIPYVELLGLLEWAKAQLNKVASGSGGEVG